MATYSSREIVSRRVEFIVPAAPPWGACLGDMQAAIAAARIACVERNGLDPARPLADTALRFEPRDEEIVISFTIEEVSDASS